MSKKLKKKTGDALTSLLAREAELDEIIADATAERERVGAAIVAMRALHAPIVVQAQLVGPVHFGTEEG